MTQKHHYRDLAEEARKVLGSVPKQFLEYFTSRFPLLLIHTWLAMRCVREEPGLHEYYDSSYLFPQVSAKSSNTHLRMRLILFFRISLH